MQIDEPGTVDDLVADAATAGYQVTIRLIRDWASAGLLDRPNKRPAGKGHGSAPALYSANQRMLLLTLLTKRPDNGIRSLARIPVGIWMYWGDEHVPARQARRALKTWVGDPRVSMERARETVREVVRQLDNPAATRSDRRELVDVLADIAYRAKPDYTKLESAVRAVFEPGSQQIRRAVGHPSAPMMADAMVDLVKARIQAVKLLMDDRLTDDRFYWARHAHLVSYAEYAMRQPLLAASMPGSNRDMYEPVTAEAALNDCCGHLLTTIGLQHMYPERAAHLHAIAGSPDVRSISPTARQAIMLRLK